MWAAIALPILTGRLRYAQRFIAANVVAFLLALPLFALIPAIGPWYGYHMVTSASQLEAQTNLLQLRTPGPHLYHPPAGVICFPSFHVIWAILSACALWNLRWLRLPILILTGLIIFSTLSFGVHYLLDIIGAIPIVIAAEFAADRLLS